METGPVYRIPLDALSPRILVCAGEDPEEWRAWHLQQGFDSVHQHRHCYVMRREDATSILVGIGTGALEPLLVELVPATPQRVILVGTAGTIGDVPAKPYLVAPAVAGIHCLYLPGELEPQIDTDLPSLRGIQTELFYAFSSAGAKAHFDPGVMERVPQLLAGPPALVDMECATFYAYAKHLHFAEYGCIRVPANSVDAFGDLVDQGPLALQDALQAGIDVLLGGP